MNREFKNVITMLDRKAVIESIGGRIQFVDCTTSAQVVKKVLAWESRLYTQHQNNRTGYIMGAFDICDRLETRIRMTCEKQDYESLYFSFSDLPLINKEELIL